jgi:hypothetical protein
MIAYKRWYNSICVVMEIITYLHYKILVLKLKVLLVFLYILCYNYCSDKNITVKVLNLLRNEDRETFCLVQNGLRG